MAEGYPPPDYIVNNWTDELFNLMVEKLVERKKREHLPLDKGNPPADRSVSIETLSAMSGGMVKVVKKDGD